MAGTMEKVDGRRARGLRTRDAIVSALLDLIGEGDIAPTAQRIADRARVSVRSVYQHFVDVEGLYSHGTDKMFEWVRTTAPDVDEHLPLERRLDLFVADRTSVLEALLPFHRAIRLMEPSCETVREHRSAMDRWHKERVARVFAPELRAVDSPSRTALHCALDSLSSTECWEHLRNSGQSQRTARQVVRAGMLGLLGGTERARA
ncbi:MAG: TetR/AcrR family transcriptional regulator [Acidimicrobiales bacterium]